MQSSYNTTCGFALSNIFCIIGLLLILSGCSPAPAWNSTDIQGKVPNLEFSLMRQDGEKVTQANYLGQPTLLFFGYTHCPDVCPMTLSKLKAALKALPEQVREQYRVLFVSVDPERDDLTQLSTYTSAFGDNFIGLTGNDTEISQVAKRFFVAYSRDKNAKTDSYEITHSSMVYAFDQKGHARLLIRDESAQAISDDLLALARQ